MGEPGSGGGQRDLFLTIPRRVAGGRTWSPAPRSQLIIAACQAWEAVTLYLLFVGENKIWSESI